MKYACLLILLPNYLAKCLESTKMYQLLLLVSGIILLFNFEIKRYSQPSLTTVTHNRHFSFVYLLGVTRPTTIRERIEKCLCIIVLNRKHTSNPIDNQKIFICIRSIVFKNNSFFLHCFVAYNLMGNHQLPVFVLKGTSSRCHIAGLLLV